MLEGTVSFHVAGCAALVAPRQKTAARTAVQVFTHPAAPAPTNRAGYRGKCWVFQRDFRDRLQLDSNCD